MCGFDLFKLILKNALRIAWICLVFALLFAIVLFVNLVKSELSASFYGEIISEAGKGYVSAVCDYTDGTQCDVDAGVYYTASGETYNVTISYGNADLEVNSYSRGINVCRVFSVWQNYVAGDMIETGVGGIWVYDILADGLGIFAGQSLTIEGDYTKTYTVCGTYTSEICESLCIAYTPSFIIADGNEKEGAVVVVQPQDVYSLYLTDLGKTVTDDGGIMDLCEGYYMSDICFAALLAFFCIAAILLGAKLINYGVNHFSTQNFLMSVFGLSKARQSALYFAVFAVFGLVSLALGLGIFYILAGVTQSLSLSIMSMKFASISPGIAVLYVILAYFAAALVTIFLSLRKKRGGV